MLRDPSELNFWGRLQQRAMQKGGLMKAYQEQQLREDVKGMVGARQTPYEMSDEELFPGEAQETAAPGLMTKGTGLIGGETTPAEFYGGLLSTPGYQSIGAQGLMNMSNQAAQMQRDQATKQPMYGQFKDYDQYLKARQSLRKEWTPQLAPSRESIRKFNQATDIVSKKKGFVDMTGADDTVLIKAFASMILPGEAVMEGDIATIVNQSGLPGTIQSYLQAFKGAGQLGKEQRQEIYAAMTGLAQRANQENVDIRMQMQPDIQAGQFDQRGLFRAPLQYEPYAPPPKGFK